MTSVQQQRLGADTISFQTISVNTRSTTVVQSALYDAVITGSANFAGSTVLGLGTYSMSVTASNVGAGAGQCVATTDSSGNVQFRRIQAGTDLAISSTTDTITLSLAPSITRTDTTVNGAFVGNLNAITSVTCSSVNFTGNVSVTGTFSPAIPTSAIWAPLNKADLLTVDTSGNAISHVAIGLSDNLVLSVDNTSPSGLSWITQPNIAQNIETTISASTAGQLLYIGNNTNFTTTGVSTGYNYITTQYPDIMLLSYDSGATGWTGFLSEVRPGFNIARTNLDASLTFTNGCIVSNSLQLSTPQYVTGTGTSRYVVYDQNNGYWQINTKITSVNGTDPVYLCFDQGTPLSTGTVASVSQSGSLNLYSATGTIPLVGGLSSTATLTFRRLTRYTSTDKVDKWLMDIPEIRQSTGSAFNSFTIVTPTASLSSLQVFYDSIPIGTAIYAPVIIGFAANGTFAGISDIRAGSVAIERDTNGNFGVVFRYDGTQYSSGAGYLFVYPTVVSLAGTL